jgi:hypothetical protein
LEFLREGSAYYRFSSAYFWPFDEGQFQAAHAWLVAPPFLLVDIAIKLQQFNHDVSRYLPEMVLAMEANQTRGSEDDLVSPIARAHFQTQGISRGMLISKVGSWLPQFWSVFPPGGVESRDSLIKYTPTGISASDLPLEEIASLVLSGRTGIQIYNEVIKPNL